ncbi:MAG: fimbrillin family protein [Bacteroidaceae bacterium]|nr:fimbrillin family protein [Bacteroidaceae bacterium]
MKTLKYIALAALTLSFAACEQEDINPAVQGDPDAVKINATIGAMQTRVAYSGDNGVTNFVNGDAIKVVNLMRTSKNEATYTTTDGTNWTTTDAMVWNSSSKNHFQAYYPVAVYSSYDTFTIPTDQSDATKLASADWMTASTGEIDKPGNGVLDLSFQHRLAKVTVNLTFGSQYPEGCQYVSDFTFYTNEETQQAITPLANSETSYTAILRPGEYADESYFIFLTMDDIEEHYVLGKTTTSAINLDAGKHYTFTLKVGKDVVSIDEVTVADWEEEEIDGGVAEEVTPTIDLSKYTDGETVNIAEDCRVIGDGNEYHLTLNVTDDAKVTFAAGASGVKLAAPITVADGKTLTLTIRDNVEHIVNGGISLGNGSNVIIEGERNKENNKLTVTGTDGNAGIGANNGVTAGDITISNARVEATGSSTSDESIDLVCGAGIGTSNGSMGNILIENSIIVAEGGYYEYETPAPAIGMGEKNGIMGDITIVDSEITATNNGEGFASVIGAIDNDGIGTMGDIVITNCELNLTMVITEADWYGAFIGPGLGGSSTQFNMGKIIFTDMTKEELDEMIATWNFPEDFAEFGKYAIGLGYLGIYHETQTYEGIWVSDGADGLVRIDDGYGYHDPE